MTQMTRSMRYNSQQNWQTNAKKKQNQNGKLKN